MHWWFSSELTSCLTISSFIPLLFRYLNAKSVINGALDVFCPILMDFMLIHFVGRGFRAHRVQQELHKVMITSLESLLFSAAYSSSTTCWWTLQRICSTVLESSCLLFKMQCLWWNRLVSFADISLKSYLLLIYDFHYFTCPYISYCSLHGAQ